MEKHFMALCMGCREIFDAKEDNKCPNGCQEIVYNLSFYIQKLESQVNNLHQETLEIYRKESYEAKSVLEILKESFRDVIHYNKILQEQNRRLRGALNNSQICLTKERRKTDV